MITKKIILTLITLTIFTVSTNLLAEYQGKKLPRLNSTSMIIRAGRIGRVQKPSKKITIGTIDSVNQNISVVSEKKAEELFDKINNKDIPWNYVEDGCFARATKTSQILDEEKIESAKIFIIPTSEPLTVKTDRSEKGYVEWNEYHTAVAIKVEKDDGTIETYVLDPSLFSQAVPATQWYDIQTNMTKSYYTFYTNKYHLFPHDRAQTMNEYSSDILRITNETNEKYLELLKEKEKEKEKER